MSTDNHIDASAGRDCVLNWVFEDMPVRGIAVQLDQSLQQIIEQHNYVGVLRNLLASFLAYSVLLRASYKESGKLIVQLQNDGALNLIVAQCRDNNEISGVIRWQEEAKPEELKLTQGQIVVTLMRSGNQPPYQSIVPYQTEALDQALSNYFQQSDQVFTHFCCLPSENSVFAMVLQVLPSSEGMADQLFRQCVAQLEQYCQQAILLDPPSILLQLQQYIAKQHCKLFPTKAVTFCCGCSSERAAQGILSMGRDEAMEILASHQLIEVKCDFCNTAYQFNHDEVERLFAKTS